MGYVIRLPRMRGGTVYETGDVWRSTQDVMEAKVYLSEPEARAGLAKLNDLWRAKGIVEPAPEPSL